MSVRARWLAGLEVLFFVTWSAAFIWIVLPLNNPRLILFNGAALFAMTIASHLARKTPLLRIGLSFSTFPGAIRLIALPTLVCTLGAIPIGMMLGSVDPDDLASGWVSNLISYPFWGFFQQYVFQGYLYVRLVDAFGGRKTPAILIAATLYTLVHFPNALLLVLCFPIGLVWAWVFSRKPNLYALGLSHGILGATIREFIKNIYWAGMRVGPHVM